MLNRQTQGFSPDVTGHNWGWSTVLSQLISLDPKHGLNNSPDDPSLLSDIPGAAVTDQELWRIQLANAATGSHWDVWMFAEAMGAMGALESATLHGAKFMGLDQDIGSLEVGKLGDLAVLSADYFSYGRPGPAENSSHPSRIGLMNAHPHLGRPGC